MRQQAATGKTKEALTKYNEALKYAPHWKQLQEAREAVAKQKTLSDCPRVADARERQLGGQTRSVGVASRLRIRAPYSAPR